MAGKGDNPRNCFSKNFKNNFDQINWNKTKKTDQKLRQEKSLKTLKRKTTVYEF